MIYGVPTIRGSKKPKQPSADAVQQQLLHQQISALINVWAIQAVCKGSQDPAAQIQAAKTLQSILNHLAQHRNACKHKPTRAFLQKRLPPHLLLTLLSSSQDEVVGVALQAAQDLAWLGVVPVDSACRLVQLLCCQNHGAAAARALTAQLSHWRFSQVWPHWSAADTTARVYQHLQYLQVQAQAADASGGSTAGRAADGCISMLMLLSKLMLLAEQHVLAQLASDADTAGRWLQLLSLVGRQHSSFAGSHASLQLLDSCCAVLAGLARAPATSLALQHSTPAQRQGVLQLLHGVLRRPCCVAEADAAQVQCWMHAAAVASLPVLWQQNHQHHEGTQQLASTLGPHEEQQLLADIAIAAAATLCNECFSSSSTAKQVDGAAANLLAAALLPSDGVYGSHRSSTSRFMAAVLGSNCCHVLLHALAVSMNTSPEHAARLAAAAAAAATAASATHVSTQAGSRAATPDEWPLQPIEATTDASGLASRSVVLAPVQQELQPAWLVLRMISAQCAAVVACADSSTAVAPVGTRSSAAPFELPDTQLSSSSGGLGPCTHVKQQMAFLHIAKSSATGSTVEPGQVLRVLQAYSGHITTGSDAYRVPGLLRSLHSLMCQSVLVLRHSPLSQRQQDGTAQLSKQQDEECKQLERLQWLSLTTDGTCSSCSSISDNEGAELSAGGQQLLSTAAAVLDLLNSSQQDLQPPAAAGAGTQRSASSGDSSKAATSTHQLSWSLAASVYVSLAITVYLQERVPGANSQAAGAGATGKCLSATDSCLALAAMQLAAAALKLLLPVVTASQAPGQVAAAAAARASLGTAPAAAGTAEQLRQQHAFVLPVYEALECSLAAMQALAVLSSLVQPALPMLLSQCINNSAGYLGHKLVPAGHGSGSSSEQGSSHGSDSSSSSQAGGVISLAAAKAIINGAAEAFDGSLQQLLSRVVLSFQATPQGTVPANSTYASHGGDRPGSQGSPLAQPQLSVHAGLQQHLQDELRCLAAAALSSCYGQLGAQTSQGAVLVPFRGHGAPFSDVQLQLGPSQRMAGHAAVLAAGCPVLRQQLFNAAAAAAAAAAAKVDGNDCCTSEQGQVHADLSSSGSTLLLKLSAVVDFQAMQQALDFIYTGAAVLPHAGLALQLQLCNSCLSPARGQCSRRLSEQQLSVLQQQQLLKLQEQQQIAKQQLHKLGMLARKLQLPLLAALTRGNRPQPGQRLPSLHLTFAALLPQQLLLADAALLPQQLLLADTALLTQQLLLPDAAGWQKRHPLANGMVAGSRAGYARLTGHNVDQEHAAQPGSQTGILCSRSDADIAHAVDWVWQQQQGLQQQDQHWQQRHAQDQQQQQPEWQHCQEPAELQQARQQVHPSSTEYLSMLAACTAAGHDAAALQLCRLQADISPAELGGEQPGMPTQAHGGCQPGTVGDSFADVYLAAPVSIAGSSGRKHLQHACSSVSAISAQQEAVGVPLDSGAGSTGLREGSGQVQYAFLPAHRVILSGCCPYFEALLSDRWHHEEYMPPVQAGSQQEGPAQHASAQAQQQQAQAARVVLVPEADIHVAAALQHFLYTGTLQVQLPAQVLNTAGVPAHAAAVAEVRSIGCSTGCHQARTLLRLWRCAELLLLPQLQLLCVAAVATAAWQLNIGCCLVLLADCCQLGVPAAAEGLLAVLMHRADHETAATMPAWADLPSGLQAVLIKAWADRRLQQDDREDLAPPFAVPRPDGVTVLPASVPAAVLGPLGPLPPAAGQLMPPVGSLGSGLHLGQGGMGVPAGVNGAVQAQGVAGQQGLVLQQRPLASSQAAVVPWQPVQDFRNAGLSLGGIVSTQLPGHNR